MKGLVTTLTVLLAASALVAPSAAAPPAGASVAIEHEATLVTPTQVLVRTVVECAAGVQASLCVSVSQQTTLGPNTNGFGGVSFTCTGAKQPFSILVNAFSW